MESFFEKLILIIAIIQIFFSRIQVKLVFSGHSKRRPKLVLKTDYRLMLVKRIAECSKGSILQYFRPSLSYHLLLRCLFCLFLSGRLRQVLLYTKFLISHSLPFADAISESNPRVIDDTRARRLANDLKRCSYYETCATYGLNVERVFQDGE